MTQVEKFPPEKISNDRIEVSYFDAIEGGAGSSIMHLAVLIQWLEEHPGCLIYYIVKIGGPKS